MRITWLLMSSTSLRRTSVQSWRIVLVECGRTKPARSQSVEERLDDRIRSRYAFRADAEDRHDRVLAQSYCYAGAERPSLIAAPDSGAAGTSS